MQNRQSGAAHVPIMFFLLLLVIFLGTLGFAYVTLTKNGELEKELSEAKAVAQEAKDQALLIEHYIQDIGRVIGKPGEYKGRPGSSSLYGGAQITTEGVMNPDEIKQLIEKKCADAGVSVSIGLENVLTSMATRISQADQRVKDISQERDIAMNQKAEIDGKFRTATSDASSKAREYASNLDQVRSDYETAKTEKDNTITNLRQNLVDKDAKMLSDSEASADREKKLKGQISELENHNSALTSRESLRKPANVADGKVIAARTGVRTAFINLGKKDLLQPDTMFRIRNPRSETVKGYAKVLRVEQERAEVQLVNITDPVGDYIREGDLIYNDLYTPGMPRTIYLMGRFSAPYNKDTLASLLKRLGNKVVTRMGPGVDTVVLGNDPVTEDGDGFTSLENTDEYKKAVALRVEFAPLLKIRDLVATR
ncbi:MAG: hypothetical protein NXI31_19145 [bacterium]|nr:hypothetical protein [bacterium]